jgi:hypothetical protein
MVTGSKQFYSLGLNSKRALCLLLSISPLIKPVVGFGFCFWFSLGGTLLGFTRYCRSSRTIGIVIVIVLLALVLLLWLMGCATSSVVLVGILLSTIWSLEYLAIWAHDSSPSNLVGSTKCFALFLLLPVLGGLFLLGRLVDSITIAALFLSMAQRKNIKMCEIDFFSRHTHIIVRTQTNTHVPKRLGQLLLLASLDCRL